MEPSRIAQEDDNSSVGKLREAMLFTQGLQSRIRQLRESGDSASYDPNLQLPSLRRPDFVPPLPIGRGTTDLDSARNGEASSAPADGPHLDSKIGRIRDSIAKVEELLKARREEKVASIRGKQHAALDAFHAPHPHSPGSHREGPVQPPAPESEPSLSERPPGAGSGAAQWLVPSARPSTADPTTFFDYRGPPSAPLPYVPEQPMLARLPAGPMGSPGRGGYGAYGGYDASGSNTARSYGAGPNTARSLAAGAMAAGGSPGPALGGPRGTARPIGHMGPADPSREMFRGTYYAAGGKLPDEEWSEERKAHLGMTGAWPDLRSLKKVPDLAGLRRTVEAREAMHPLIADLNVGANMAQAKDRIDQRIMEVNEYVGRLEDRRRDAWGASALRRKNTLLLMPSKATIRLNSRGIGQPSARGFVRLMNVNERNQDNPLMLRRSLRGRILPWERRGSMIVGGARNRIPEEYKFTPTLKKTKRPKLKSTLRRKPQKKRSDAGAAGEETEGGDAPVTPKRDPLASASLRVSVQSPAGLVKMTGEDLKARLVSDFRRQLEDAAGEEGVEPAALVALDRLARDWVASGRDLDAPPRALPYRSSQPPPNPARLYRAPSPPRSPRHLVVGQVVKKKKKKAQRGDRLKDPKRLPDSHKTLSIGAPNLALATTRRALTRLGFEIPDPEPTPPPAKKKKKKKRAPRRADEAGGEGDDSARTPLRTLPEGAEVPSAVRRSQKANTWARMFERVYAEEQRQAGSGAGAAGTESDASLPTSTVPTPRGLDRRFGTVQGPRGVSPKSGTLPLRPTQSARASYRSPPGAAGGAGGAVNASLGSSDTGPSFNAMVDSRGDAGRSLNSDHVGPPVRSAVASVDELGGEGAEGEGEGEDGQVSRSGTLTALPPRDDTRPLAARSLHLYRIQSGEVDDGMIPSDAEGQVRRSVPGGAPLPYGDHPQDSFPGEGEGAGFDGDRPGSDLGARNRTPSRTNLPGLSAAMSVPAGYQAQSDSASQSQQEPSSRGSRGGGAPDSEAQRRMRFQTAPTASLQASVAKSLQMESHLSLPEENESARGSNISRGSQDSQDLPTSAAGSQPRRHVHKRSSSTLWKTIKGAFSLRRSQAGGHDIDDASSHGPGPLNRRRSNMDPNPDPNAPRSSQGPMGTHIPSNPGRPPLPYARPPSNPAAAAPPLVSGPPSVVVLEGPPGSASGPGSASSIPPGDSDAHPLHPAAHRLSNNSSANLLPPHPPPAAELSSEFLDASASAIVMPTVRFTEAEPVRDPHAPSPHGPQQPPSEAEWLANSNNRTPTLLGAATLSAVAAAAGESGRSSPNLQPVITMSSVGLPHAHDETQMPDTALPTTAFVRPETARAETPPLGYENSPVLAKIAEGGPRRADDGSGPFPSQGPGLQLGQTTGGRRRNNVVSEPGTPPTPPNSRGTVKTPADERAAAAGSAKPGQSIRGKAKAGHAAPAHIAPMHSLPLGPQSSHNSQGSQGGGGRASMERGIGPGGARGSTVKAPPPAGAVSQPSLPMHRSAAFDRSSGDDNLDEHRGFTVSGATAQQLKGMVQPHHGRQGAGAEVRNSRASITTGQPRGQVTRTSSTKVPPVSDAFADAEKYARRGGTLRGPAGSPVPAPHGPQPGSKAGGSYAMAHIRKTEAHKKSGSPGATLRRSVTTGDPLGLASDGAPEGMTRDGENDQPDSDWVLPAHLTPTPSMPPSLGVGTGGAANEASPGESGVVVGGTFKRLENIRESTQDGRPSLEDGPKEPSTPHSVSTPVPSNRRPSGAAPLDPHHRVEWGATQDSMVTPAGVMPSGGSGRDLPGSVPLTTSPGPNDGYRDAFHSAGPSGSGLMPIQDDAMRRRVLGLSGTSGILRSAAQQFDLEAEERGSTLAGSGMRRATPEASFAVPQPQQQPPQYGTLPGGAGGGGGGNNSSGGQGFLQVPGSMHAAGPSMPPLPPGLPSGQPPGHQRTLSSSRPSFSSRAASPAATPGDKFKARIVKEAPLLVAEGVANALSKLQEGCLMYKHKIGSGGKGQERKMCCEVAGSEVRVTYKSGFSTKKVEVRAVRIFTGGFSNNRPIIITGPDGKNMEIMPPTVRDYTMWSLGLNAALLLRDGQLARGTNQNIWMLPFHDAVKVEDI